jgi:peptidoglycan-associated lipoprotein
MRVSTLALSVVIIVSGCGPRRPPAFNPGAKTDTQSTKPTVQPPANDSPTVTITDPDSAGARSRETMEVLASLSEKVYFAFNSDSLDGQSRIKLDRKVKILQSNPQLKIRIAGHADERGSDAYNLVLGNKRAAAAKAYLESKGIEASRIDIFSYGEERPDDPASNEEAWARNRRDEFDATSGAQRLVKPQ